MRTRIVAVLLISLLAISCSSSDPADGADSSEVESPEVSAGTIPTDATVVAGVRGPSNAAAALETMLAVVNGETIDIDQYERIFNATFRSAVSYDAFLDPLIDLVPAGPWSIVGNPEISGSTGTVTISSPNSPEQLEMSAEVDPSSATIVSLFLAPVTEAVELSSVDDAVAQLNAMGELRMVVATVNADGEVRCTPTRSEFGIDVMPLGSIFKVYVLGAVVNAVAAGDLAWDTPITIDDALDSLPSGTTQDVEPGTELTVRELADLMISISDNTATDHLIATVGRDAVEAMLVEMGNDSLERNLPLLTTRELFILKTDEELATQYLAADTDGRRALLAGPVASAPLPDLANFDISGPVLVDELEWFGSPLAVCNAFAWLADEPIAVETMAINPGVPDVENRWESIMFKGGSEPGLLTLGWLTTDSEGNRQSTVVGVQSTGLLDEAAIAEIAAFVRDNS